MLQVGDLVVATPHLWRYLAMSLGAFPDDAAAVRPFATGGDAARQRLKAFIVPAPGVAVEGLESRMGTHAAEQLSSPERPAAHTFGPELPLNAMGKLTDWT